MDFQDDDFEFEIEDDENDIEYNINSYNCVEYDIDYEIEDIAPVVTTASVTVTPQKKKVVIAEELNKVKNIENRATYRATDSANDTNDASDRTTVAETVIEYDRTTTKKKKKTEVEEFVQSMEEVDKWAIHCNPNKIFIAKSSFTDDNKIIALIVKFNIIPYKCAGKGCNISTSWLGQPIQLLVIRKNNNSADLTPNNLQLYCGNCYMTEYGAKLFKKTSECVTIKCNSCGIDITQVVKKYKKHIEFCYKCLNQSMQEKLLLDEQRRIRELSKITGEDLTPSVFQEINADDQASLREKSGIVKKPRKPAAKSSQNSSRTGETGSQIPMDTDAINIGDLLSSYKNLADN